MVLVITRKKRTPVVAGATCCGMAVFSFMAGPIAQLSGAIKAVLVLRSFSAGERGSGLRTGVDGFRPS